MVATVVFTCGDSFTAVLIAGAAFTLVVVFFSSPAGTVGNVALAAVQFGLAFCPLTVDPSPQSTCHYSDSVLAFLD